MKPDIKAIYFDLDDTLCAYWSASRRGLRAAFEEAELDCGAEKAIEAWRKVFSSFSPEIKSEHWYTRYLESGEPTRTEHMRRTLVELGCADDKVAERLSKRYAELRDQCLELFPEAKEVLSFLRDKYKLGLITNGPADVQRQEIETLEIAGFFDHVLIEGEFKQGKPNIEIFEAARQKWGYAPQQMLFAGNAYEHDVQGAKNAGWWAIWVNKSEQENPGTQPKPDAEIRNLWQLADWLGLEAPAQTRTKHSTIPAH